VKINDIIKGTIVFQLLIVNLKRSKDVPDDILQSQLIFELLHGSPIYSFQEELHFLLFLKLIIFYFYHHLLTIVNCLLCNFE
jgi:hypothetical protein